MNILIFNWRCWLNPEAGGSEKYIHELFRRIAEKGNKVTLFTSRFNGSKEKEVVDDIEIIRKGGKYSVYVQALLQYLIHFRKQNYDIIIDNINGVPFFTPLYAWKPRKIAIIHHLVKDIFFKELPIYASWLGWLSEKTIPIVYRSTEFITVSKSSKIEMREFGIKNHIYIVYNGVDSKKIQKFKVKKSKSPTIIFVGRLKKYKQINHLIESMKIVSRSIPNTKLWIVGDGDAKKELKGLTRQLKLTKQIKFWGHVKEDTKIKLLKKSWLFVTASSKEGWSISVIEAAAGGIPAIAYDVPGLRDSVINNKTGLLVNSDYKDLATAIINALRNKELIKTMGRNSLMYSRQFNWDKSANEFLRIIRGV